MKPVMKWLKVNWVWIGVGGVTLLIGGLGYKLFSTYAEKLPFVSSEHAAWASFGSLLAGFFTLTGTIATVATLLFLARQNKSIQKVTQSQMDSLTFERYINHRKLFSDHLNEQVAVHKDVFKFRDPSHLYSSIFPKNSPHHCDFSIKPEYDENGDGDNYVGDMLASLNRLKMYLDQAQFTDSELDDLVLHLIGLARSVFMIEPIDNPREGDVLFNDKHYGFNIYSLDGFVGPCLSIANLILRFTNNPVVNERSFQSRSRYVREALMKRLLIAESRNSIKLKRQIKGVPDLGSIYFQSQEIRNGKDYLFPATVRVLNVVFGSDNSLNLLLDDSKFDDVLNVCLNEVAQTLLILNTDDENYKPAVKVRDKLNLLINRADFK